MRRFAALTVLTALLLSASSVCRAQLPAHIRNKVDAMMNEGLSEGYYPGASIAIGDRTGILYSQQYGYADSDKTIEVTPDHVYDIASITKVAATTLAVMLIYDMGIIDLDAKVGDYIGNYAGSPVSDITILQLLTHTSGLPYFPAYSLLFSSESGLPLISTKYNTQTHPYPVDKGAYLCCDPKPNEEYVSFFQPDGSYRQIGPQLYVNPSVDALVEDKIKRSYSASQKNKYKYTDSNFYILRQIIENIVGMPIDQYLALPYAHLEMTSTGYNPLGWTEIDLIVPTEYDMLMQRGQVRGYVHDDLASISGNVEGNAGLFSNASDLSNFCIMMLNKGTFKGKRVISEQTIEKFTSSPLASSGIYRGLGFDKRGPSSSLYNGYGHTGYTGTMIWMDDESGLFFVFLSNRVCPSRLNDGLVTSQLRFKLWNLVKKGLR